MATVIVELKIEGDEATAHDVVSNVLDDGVFQDKINESASDNDHDIHVTNASILYAVDGPLERARALYIELATKPEREALDVFELRTMKVGAQRSARRDDLLSALEKAKVDADAIFAAHVAGE